MTTTCIHPKTFLCHDTQRCEVCHMDMFKRKDGSLVWASQDDPCSWSAERITKWFMDERLYSYNQGCDGFEFTRQNLVEGRPYGYIWVEVTLDLDYEMAWMVDVRRHDGDDEYRQFLFIASGVRHHVHSAWHGVTSKFGTDGGERLVSGLRWFADQVEVWNA